VNLAIYNYNYFISSPNTKSKIRT